MAKEGEWKRRAFLASAGWAAGGAAAALGAASIGASSPGREPQQDDDSLERAGRLRTIAYNVYACDGWPKTRRNQARLARAKSQIPARLTLELALYDPHIVTFCEAPAENLVAEIASQLEMNYVYFEGGFPGAILSVYPIVAPRNFSLQSEEAPGDLFTRHFGQAVLELDDGELAVYSAHLNPHKQQTRLCEIAAILDTMARDLEANRPLLLQGDLNHRPDTPEYRKWIAGGLIDAFATKGNGGGATSRANKPVLRIDYVWAHGPLAAHLASCRALFEGAFRLNPEDPAGFALSDHLPVMAAFENRLNSTP